MNEFYITLFLSGARKNYWFPFFFLSDTDMFNNPSNDVSPYYHHFYRCSEKTGS